MTPEEARDIVANADRQRRTVVAIQKAKLFTYESGDLDLPGEGVPESDATLQVFDEEFKPDLSHIHSFHGARFEDIVGQAVGYVLSHNAPAGESNGTATI